MLKPLNRWFGGGRGGGPSQSSRLPIIVISLSFILVVGFFTTRKNQSSLLGLISTDLPAPDSSDILNPTQENVNGTRMIWQMPISPKAVLFIAPGCSIKARDFWDKSSSCPKCVGLPEDRRVVLDALARNFAVLVISSQGSCWTYGPERVAVRRTIEWWVEKHGLMNLPMVALGASSGGYFVSLLANEMQFQSVVIMIAEGMFDRMDIRPDYPPALFVHMPKDQERNNLVHKAISLLKGKGIEANEVKCLEFRLTPKFLADRIPGLELTTATSLLELLRSKELIDVNGYMQKDGREIPWVQTLKGSQIHFPYGNVTIRHVQEELNLAFAYHEMTSMVDDKIFGWFESHMR